MMVYILFLFYYIGTEIQKVNSSNRVILAQQQELSELVEIRNKRYKTKLTMLTQEYQDRIKKEREGILNPGEKRLLLTKDLDQYRKLEEFREQEEHEYYLQKPIIEEWKNIFFPKQT